MYTWQLYMANIYMAINTPLVNAGAFSSDVGAQLDGTGRAVTSCWCECAN